MGGYTREGPGGKGQEMDIKEAQRRAAEAKEASFDDPYYDRANIEARQAAAQAEAESLTELVAWLEAQTWSEFAVSLADQFHRRGSLSERQVQSARSMKAKCDARQAQREAAAATEASTPGTGLDLTSIPSGHYGVPGGDTRLKVRIDNVTKGKWAGWVFVKDGAEYGAERRYGKQAPGSTYKGEIESQLRAIAADPQEAAAEYGRLTGRCGICNRQLEDEQSVARGIGPVCAAKVGW